MVLLALASLIQTPAELPAWAYTYELPTSDYSRVNSVIAPAGGFGGGQTTTVKAEPLAPIRLAAFVPDLSDASDFTLGKRLNASFISRATRRVTARGEAVFSQALGPARVAYTLDERNKIVRATYLIPLTVSASEGRFDALRRALDRTFGPALRGQRDGGREIATEWFRTDRSAARLALHAVGTGLVLFATLATDPQTLQELDAKGRPVIPDAGA